MDVTTKISSRGQLVIPVDLRKKYKLEAGTLVRIGERDGQIKVTPNPPDPYDAFIAMRGIMAHIEEDVGGVVDGGEAQGTGAGRPANRTVMKEYVLDANALVRLYRDTPGADKVQNLAERAKAGRARLSISSVNLAELLYVLSRYFGFEKAQRLVEGARLVAEAAAVDARVALDAAALRFKYKLGLADCFAAELAMRKDATLVTADPEFSRFGKQLKVLALPRHGM